MKIFKQNDQSGFAHMVEIVIIGVVVLGIAGFIGWRVMTAQSGTGANNSATNNNQASTAIPCTSSDKDLCKFFASWKVSENQKVTMSMTSGGQTSSSVFESSNSGKNYHMVMSVSGTPYEIIVIDSTTYTKAGSTWYKQTTKSDTATSYKDSFTPDVKEPETKTPDTKDTTPVTTYKKIGAEKCGNLDCLKYQVVDPSSTDTTQFLWFDTKDYQLRRMHSESTNGDVTDQVFEYGNVNITVPSPVKDLGPNQYIVPGQSEPMTMPSYQ